MSLRKWKIKYSSWSGLNTIDARSVLKRIAYHDIIYLSYREAVRLWLPLHLPRCIAINAANIAKRNKPITIEYFCLILEDLQDDWIMYNHIGYIDGRRPFGEYTSIFYNPIWNDIIQNELNPANYGFIINKHDIVWDRSFVANRQII